MFSCEFCEISRNIFSHRTPLAASDRYTNILNISTNTPIPSDISQFTILIKLNMVNFADMNLNTNIFYKNLSTKNIVNLIHLTRMFSLIRKFSDLFRGNEMETVA